VIKPVDHKGGTHTAQSSKKTSDAGLLDVQLGAGDGLTLAAWIRQDPALLHTASHRSDCPCHGNAPGARVTGGLQRV